VNKRSAWLIGLVSLGVLILSAWRGAHVPFSEQWPLYEALRNTAAIIFAVVGAWLAIVYPERLRGVFQRPGEGQDEVAKDSKDNGRRAIKLVLPILNTTLILAVVLFVGILVPLVKGLHAVQSNIEIFRSLSYVLLSSLTLLQAWTVIFTLVPASDMKDQILKEEATSRAVSSVFSHVAKADDHKRAEHKRGDQ